MHTATSDNNAASDNYQLGTGGLHAGTVAGLEVGWARIPIPLSNRIGGTAVAGDKVYLAHEDGSVQRVHPTTGTVESTVVITGRQLGQLAVVGGRMYLRTWNDSRTRSYLAAYTPAGVMRWEAELTDEVVSPFVVGGGLVLATAGPQCQDVCVGFELRAFRADTGMIAWRAPVDGDAYSFAGPVIIGDTVVQAAYGPVGDGADTLAFGYRLSSGVRRWVKVTPGFDAAGWGGRTFLSGYEGICSYTTGTGADRWCVKRTGQYFDELAFGPGALYVDGPDQEIISLVPDTGAERWRRSYDRG